MIIDTSNAPCGPGFLPGLRLSEGRFAINRETPLSSGGAGLPRLGLSQAGQPPRRLSRLRPPKCRLTHPHCPPIPPLRRVRARLSVDVKSLRAVRVTACPRSWVWGGLKCCGGSEFHVSPAGASAVSPALRELRLEPRLATDRASPHRGRSPTHSTTTSDQTRQPAEFKHITKRRKRN